MRVERGLDPTHQPVLHLAATSVDGGRGAGRRRTVASTMTASAPSEPTRSRVSVEEHDNALAYDHPMFSGPMSSADLIAQLG